MRRPFKAGAPVKDGPRSNKEIRVPTVQLIDAEGKNHGEVPTHQALQMAEEAGLDLVEISPNAVPPVTKILDLGKLKYANQKKAAEARKHQKVIEIKEIKMRPNIDDHDYETKMKAVRRFFDEGDKVKLTLR
ncbi:MAG: translation initiation factor IF-3, partial [Rhizobiaceae bacterium]|nr:translation initiation factor IF-3 [Rhizobiaceae bacterium]